MRAAVVALIVGATLQLTVAPAADAAGDAWTGTVAQGGAVVYDAPGGSPVGSLDLGSQVSVNRWVYGPQLTSDNYTWADICGGRFVHSSVLRHAALPSSPPAPTRVISDGHWADANLTLQIFTMYDGSRPVHMSLMNSGRPGADTESHTGVWPIE